MGNPNFMDMRYNNGILENPRPIDFMETKYDFMGNGGDLCMMGGLGDMSNSTHGLVAPNYHGIPFGMSLDGTTGNYMDGCHKLTFPYDAHEDQIITDVKPNAKLLSLEWQDQGCCDGGKDSFGYPNTGLGSWTSLMNGYGSSATNPMV